MLHYLDNVIKWGAEKENTALYKKILITNQLSLILIIPFFLFLLTAFVFDMYHHVGNISLIMLHCLVVPLLNRYGFTNISRLLLSAGSTLLITVSSIFLIFTHPEVSNLTMGIASRVFLLCFAALPLVIFNKDDGQWMGASLAISALCVLFFDELHAIFGIQLSQLDYIPWKHDILRASISIAFLTIMLLFYVMKLIHEQYENRITAQNKRLKESNQLKDKLLSIVSHDLRSPLNSLKASLELSRSGSLSQSEYQSISEKLGSQLDSTVTVMDNLLKWAQSQMKGMAVNPTAFAVRTLIEEVTTFTELQAQQKSVTIINEVMPEVKVWGDREMLMVAIRNLVSNAIKFSYRGSLITINTCLEGDSIALQIRDNGVGLTESEKANIFSHSKHFSKTGTENEKGSGVGLLLAKEFVEKNQGSLTVESKLGEGSTFTVSLPWFRERESERGYLFTEY